MYTKNYFLKMAISRRAYNLLLFLSFFFFLLFFSPSNMSVVCGEPDIRQTSELEYVTRSSPVNTPVDIDFDFRSGTGYQWNVATVLDHKPSSSELADLSNKKFIGSEQVVHKGPVSVTQPKMQSSSSSNGLYGGKRMAISTINSSSKGHFYIVYVFGRAWETAPIKYKIVSFTAQ